MSYTMNDIKNIARDIEIDLPKEVINIINFLASKVGAPSYKKTPNFNNKSIVGLASNFRHYFICNFFLEHKYSY